MPCNKRSSVETKKCSLMLFSKPIPEAHSPCQTAQRVCGCSSGMFALVLICSCLSAQRGLFAPLAQFERYTACQKPISTVSKYDIIISLTMKCVFYNKAQKDAINKIILQTFLNSTRFLFIRYSVKQTNHAVHVVD